MEMPTATPLEHRVRMSYWEDGTIWGEGNRVLKEISEHEAAIVALKVRHAALKQKLMDRGIRFGPAPVEGERVL